MRVTPIHTPLEVGAGDSARDGLDLFSATSTNVVSPSTSGSGATSSWRRRFQSVVSQLIWEIESGIEQNRETRVNRILLSDVQEAPFDQAIADGFVPGISAGVPHSIDQNVGSLTACVCTHEVSRPDYLDRSGVVCKPWQCKG